MDNRQREAKRMTIGMPRPADCQSAIQPTTRRRYFKNRVKLRPGHYTVEFVN
jgi:hypothetical protein